MLHFFVQIKCRPVSRKVSLVVGAIGLGNTTSSWSVLQACGGGASSGKEVTMAETGQEIYNIFQRKTCTPNLMQYDVRETKLEQ